jgi:hypothetical protein
MVVGCGREKVKLSREFAVDWIDTEEEEKK